MWCSFGTAWAMACSPCSAPEAFRREIIESIRIQEQRFGFEPEITAKVARRRCRIVEVGMIYYGRTYYEGKKIG